MFNSLSETVRSYVDIARQGILEYQIYNAEVHIIGALFFNSQVRDLKPGQSTSFPASSRPLSANDRTPTINFCPDVLIVKKIEDGAYQLERREFNHSWPKNDQTLAESLRARNQSTLAFESAQTITVGLQRINLQTLTGWGTVSAVDAPITRIRWQERTPKEVTDRQEILSSLQGFASLVNRLPRN